MFIPSFHFIFPAALIPDPVGNLRIHLDTGVPSVTLTWTPPENTKAGTQSSRSDVSRYHIRFKPKERQNFDNYEVDNSTTSVVFDRNSGLIPHKTFVFEVRAQCGDALGEWKAVSALISELSNVVSLLLQSCKKQAAIGQFLRKQLTWRSNDYLTGFVQAIA